MSGAALAAGGVAGCLGDTSGDGGDTEGSGGTEGGSDTGGNGSSTEGDGGGSSGDTPTLRYSYVGGSELIDNVAMFHQSEFMRENILQNVGDAYEMELKTAQGTPVVVSTLAAQEADAGILAYSSLANAAINDTIPGGGRVIAPFKWQTDRTPDGVYALADSAIETGQDLKGQSIAVPAIGSASDLGARAALVSIGLDPQEDVELREISFGAMPAALEEGRVQAAGMIQPFIYMMGDKIERLFPPTAGVGQHLVVFATVRSRFADQNPEVVRGLLNDLWLGLQWWTADENREKAVDIATNVIGLDESTMDALVQTDNGYYQGNNGLTIGTTCLQNPFDMMNDIGFIDQELSADEFVDNSFLPKEADEISVECG
jgi:NitT/TauT family transport system substrate-binding protein